MQDQWYKSEIKHAQSPNWVGSARGGRVRMGEEGTQKRDTEQHPAKEERLQIGLVMGR